MSFGLLQCIVQSGCRKFGYLFNGSPSSYYNRLEVEGSVASTCSGPAVEYGTGCPGTGGYVPHLSLDICPVAGSPVQLTLSNALGGASAYIFMGLGPGSASMPGTGCTLNVAPLLPITVILPMGGSGPGAGSLVIGAVLPPNTVGATVTLQFFVADPGVPHGFSNSNGVTMAVK